MTQPDPSTELDALQTLLAGLQSEAAQESLKPTGFPFQLPDGTIAFNTAKSMEVIFREIFEAGKMNVDEFVCFRLLRTRFQHECELLLLHIMARQGVYHLPDDRPQP